jgi:hypothetical protein
MIGGSGAVQEGGRRSPKINVRKGQILAREAAPALRK